MKVVKTIKMFVDGKFIRSESGRSYSFDVEGNQYARLCQGSRKDFRNAVVVAKNAQGAWAKRTAFNRSQILYRMAEMMEGKRVEFVSLFQEVLGMNGKEATVELDAAIDTFVYYAGFADKYQQVLGSTNPINGPFHNFTTPEPVGVVAHIAAEKFNFATLIDNICSIIISGNSVITLLGPECPAILAPLSEVIATSDVPAGVINLLTGHLDELYSFIATHREVRSLSFQNENKKLFGELKELAVDNMKRLVPYTERSLDLSNISTFVEFKTVWHPIGI
jgi:acyl-CoA reductase-like NAD-dependent aldehyde dehydrogenase